MKPNPQARLKILDAALTVIRTQGYSATTIDDLCVEAGVTKGAFFHYFDSKEHLAVSAAEHWSAVTDAFFETAPYRALKDPLERLLGYVEFRQSIISGELPEFTCLVGTMVQETFDSNPAIREACRKSIFNHTAEVTRYVTEARRARAPKADWTPESLALHIQAVIQGAFILAKATGGTRAALDCLSHLRRYLDLTFNVPTQSLNLKRKP